MAAQFTFRTCALQCGPEPVLRRGEELITLTINAALLLQALLERSQPRRIIPHEELEAAVWSHSIDRSSLERAVSDLRKALGDDANVVKTVRNRGYLINKDVEVQQTLDVPTNSVATNASAEAVAIALPTAAASAVDLSLRNYWIDRYSLPEINAAVKAVHDAARNLPSIVEETPLDDQRRLVSHFWIHLSDDVFSRGPGFEDLMKRAFSQGVDDWPPLEPLEVMKLTEERRRGGYSEPEVREWVNDAMAKHRARKLYERWRSSPQRAG